MVLQTALEGVGELIFFMIDPGIMNPHDAARFFADNGNRTVRFFILAESLRKITDFAGIELSDSRPKALERFGMIVVLIMAPYPQLQTILSLFSRSSKLNADFR